MISTFRSATRTIALAAAVVAGSSGSAYAALTCAGGASNTVGTFTCTETVSFIASNIDVSSAPLTLDKWSSFASAGFTQTLTGVNWSVGAQVESTANFNNLTAATISNFSITNNSSVLFSAGATAPATFLVGGLTSTRSATTSLQTLNPGSGFTLIYGPAPTTTLTGQAANLTGYGGAGTFQALVSTSTAEFPSNAGITMSNRTFSTTPGLTLTYTFQTAAVPEAPSVVLMGLGLAGLVAVARQRRRV